MINCTSVFITFFVLLSSLELYGAETLARMAPRGRLDLIAESDVGELRQIHFVGGNGEAERMDWLDQSKRLGSITAEFSIWPFGWRKFEIRFTPQGSGIVNLELLGPFQSINNKNVKLEVLWDALRVEGAELGNGSFERSAVDANRGWKKRGGEIVEADPQLPAKDGKRVARTWHDGRLSTTLRVTANQPVRIHGFARAALPADYVMMARIESRDTPAHRAAKKFLRGVNLGNYLEAPPGQDWGAKYGAEDLAFIRQEGFDHVRIPVGWHHYAGPAPDFPLQQGIFQRVDALVREATKRNLNVMINIHHFDEFTSNPQRERARFLAIWRQLAEHYANEKDGVAFELLNEPKDEATTEVLNGIYPEAITVIRRSNPTRTIFLGPSQWNSVEELPKLRLPADEMNVIVTVHSYLPMNFTHQGASWTGPDFMLTGVRFPGPPETPLRIPPGLKPRPHVVDWIQRYNTLPKASNPSSEIAFKGYLEQAHEWSDYFGRPVHLGEFGAIDKADAQSRANYCRAVRRTAEAAGMGWALWDWKAAFRYWDTAAKRPLPGMHEALFEEWEQRRKEEKD